MKKINGISHITLICKDLNKSAALFRDLFNATEVYSSDKLNFSISKEKFFLIGDLWLALMEGPSLEPSYNHIAFHINTEDLSFFEAKIKSLGLDRLPSRPRHQEEGESIYFYDYDNHLFELHTGDLATRLRYYQSTCKVENNATKHANQLSLRRNDHDGSAILE
jgi:fosfomycin resistance protein FosX